METEEAKQLVILGNGFDLHFKQKTKFKDYLDSFSIDNDKNKLDVLFKSLFALSGLNMERYRAEESVEQNFENMKLKKEELENNISCMRNRLGNGNKKRDLFDFYIKVRCDQIKHNIIPDIRKSNKEVKRTVL